MPLCVVCIFVSRPCRDLQTASRRSHLDKLALDFSAQAQTTAVGNKESLRQRVDWLFDQINSLRTCIRTKAIELDLSERCSTAADLPTNVPVL